MAGTKLRKLIGLIKCFLLSSLCPSLNVGSACLLCEDVKQYAVLYDKQMKWSREKSVVNNAWNAEAKDLGFIENGLKISMLFFMLHLV